MKITITTTTILMGFDTIEINLVVVVVVKIVVVDVVVVVIVRGNLVIIMEICDGAVVWW